MSKFGNTAGSQGLKNSQDDFGKTGGMNQSLMTNPASLKGKLMSLEVI